MISDERMTKALTFLAETDEEAAVQFADMERAEEKAKQILAAMFLTMEGTIPTKEAKAKSSREYQDAMTEYFDAVETYRHTANKRTTEELVVRAWQTVSSNRRQGNV